MENERKESQRALMCWVFHSHRLGWKRGNLIIWSPHNGYKEPLICFISSALLWEWKWTFCPSAARHPALLSPSGCEDLLITALISPLCGSQRTDYSALAAPFSHSVPPCLPFSFMPLCLHEPVVFTGVNSAPSSSSGRWPFTRALLKCRFSVGSSQRQHVKLLHLLY